MKKLIYIFIFSFIFTACKITDDSTSSPKILVEGKIKELKTEYVFVLVLDGHRWSETFGDSTFANVPNQVKSLRPEGIFFTNFQNIGPTYTISGHTAITTGIHQSINNSGLDIPKKPSIFQYYRKQYCIDKRKTWILASKGKLGVIGYTKDKDWQREYMPSVYAGLAGTGTGYPNDFEMWPIFKDIIKTNKPNLTLINMLDADAWAHQGNWDRYIQGIQYGDKVALELWEMIQRDPYYKDKTTLFITNDHGRHLDGIKNGFEDHGDRCEGCKHIQLIALGPDFEKGKIVDQSYDLIDITSTIAAMMKINMPVEGKVIKELFE